MMLISCLFLTIFIGSASSINYDDCGRKISCYRDPSDCKDNCEVAISWKTSGDQIQFEMYTKKDDYVAIGFSTDKKMGQDSVIACQKSENGLVEVQLYRNIDVGKIEKLELSGITNITGKAESDELSCTFSRNQVYNNSKIYDLTKKKKYYLLVAQGSVKKDTIEKHRKVGILKSQIPFTKLVNVIGSKVRASGMVKAHGILMVMAWMILVPIGAITARYYRTFFRSEKTPGETWFFIHWFCMGSAAILTIIGAVLIFVHAGGFITYDTMPMKLHPILGVVTIALAVLNPIMGIIKPDESSSLRPIFNWLHRLGGMSAGILGFVNVMIGTRMPAANVRRTMLWWILSLLILLILFGIILELLGCEEEDDDGKDDEETGMKKLGSEKDEEKQLKGEEKEKYSGKDDDQDSNSDNEDTPKSKSDNRRKTRQTLYAALHPACISIEPKINIEDQSDLNRWKERLKSKMDTIRKEQEKLQNMLKNDFAITNKPQSNNIPAERNEKANREMFKVVGVHKDDIHQYRPDENNMFKCISSNVKIPFKNVNDDYCDCPDQSDEPGTSACPNSRFYCTFQLSMSKRSAKWVPSGSVGDSICDCCDGSDEWQRFNDIKNPKNDVYNKLQVYHTPCVDLCTELRNQKQQEEEIRILAASTRMKYVKQGKDAPSGEDYGPQNVFYPLSKKCFTFKSNEYEYSICPFKEIKQTNSNSHSVSAGSQFKWLSRTPYDFSIIMTGGEGKNCPDLERSTVIKWECGLKDSVLKVSESERCRYKVLMNSPAAC
ncbi:DgyrCDS2736 [Dimorphilus gyrociliatus]|uniref:Glucosidase 2 subunit beta n=1 Tax=Dimorphilus gyrociliatus TaxID=2664684 RepID=A0A7I8VCY5_9ANNE|nr:DgyrCDS2736 [Dimorphilus gyrociliatus]